MKRILLLATLLLAARPSPADGQTSVEPRYTPPRPLGPSAHGVSGALRISVLRSGQPIDPVILSALGGRVEQPHWEPVHGTRRLGLPGEPVNQDGLLAPDTPGMWELRQGNGAYLSGDRNLTFVTLVPFNAQRNGRLNGYAIGHYPSGRIAATDAYLPPQGFIEVTPQNQDLQISEHFKLRHFLTKDQFDVWPKYVAIEPALLDKLELVLQELNLMGARAMGMHVMSGFRTPRYNGPGGDGRAALSRHMYGDAADVWVDGDQDGYMDDLNGDGHHDIRDAAILLHAVERVEQKYPELVGGAGLYEANSAHGPYVHIDVRGKRARW